METNKISNHNSVINRTELRRRLLAYAAANRAHPFTRVSQETVEEFEAMLEARIRQHVQAMPSRGKTL